jgi:ABC-type transport system involved in cytochrome c biogenesis permease subunit
MSVDRISIVYFAASYLVALGLELLQAYRPSKLVAWLGALFMAAGLTGHTLFLAAQHLPVSSQFGVLLYLAWILAVFCSVGAVHHRRQAWGLFVLPIVLGLVLLAAAFGQPPREDATADLYSLDAGTFWLRLHVALFVLAATGISVAFIASLMYLVQAQRLKAKALPTQGLKLLNLERLERMNRLGISLAFPLLTVGTVIGLALLIQERNRLTGWTDPRIIATILLWVVFGLVLYLRHGLHLRGRRVALLTIVAFAILLLGLVTSHSLGPGGTP